MIFLRSRRDKLGRWFYECRGKKIVRRTQGGCKLIGCEKSFFKIRNFDIKDENLKIFNLNPAGRASSRTNCSSGIGLLSERGTATALRDQAAHRQATYSIPGVAKNANLSSDLTPTEYLHAYFDEIQVQTVLQSASQILRLLENCFVIIA